MEISRAAPVATGDATENFMFGLDETAMVSLGMERSEALVTAAGILLAHRGSSLPDGILADAYPLRGAGLLD